MVPVISEEKYESPRQSAFSYILLLLYFFIIYC